MIVIAHSNYMSDSYQHKILSADKDNNSNTKEEEEEVENKIYRWWKKIQ